MKILIGLLLAAAPMATDEQNAETRMRQLIRLTPLLSAVDLNRDGSLSAEEVDKVLASIRTVDRNGDGTIHPEERLLRTTVRFQPVVRIEEEGRRDDRGGEERGRRPDSEEQRDHRSERDGGRPGEGTPRGGRPDRDGGPDRDRPQAGGQHNGDRPEGDHRQAPEMDGRENGDHGPDAHRGPNSDRREDGNRHEGPGVRGDGHDGRGPDGQHPAMGAGRGPGGPEGRDGEHRGPSNGGRPGFGRGFGPGQPPGPWSGPSFGMGGGFGRAPQMMGRIGPMAQNDRKDGDPKPPLMHRPNVPHVDAQQHQPHQIEGIMPHAVGGSTAVIGILFRLLDSDHNGSLTPREFQRIGSALNGTSGPSAGPQPSLRSGGPRLMQRPQIAQQPEGTPSRPNHGTADPRRSQHGPDPEGHRPERIEPRGNSNDKPGDHPKVEEHRSEKGPDRGERGRRRGPAGGDQARPTEAPLISAGSDWI